MASVSCGHSYANAGDDVIREVWPYLAISDISATLIKM